MALLLHLDSRDLETVPGKGAKRKALIQILMFCWAFHSHLWNGCSGPSLDIFALQTPDVEAT